MLYLVDNYDSFTYNLYQLVGQLSNEPIAVVKNDQLSVSELLARKPSRLIFSPGPGTPQKAGLMLSYLNAFIGKVPILGVCLGHQAIGTLYGAKLQHSPHLMHGKASEIVLKTPSPLFERCPKHFTGARYHSLSLATLPADLHLLATTSSDEIMGIADETKQVYGVQFHPESILTTAAVGRQLLKNFLSLS